MKNTKNKFKYYLMFAFIFIQFIIPSSVNAQNYDSYLDYRINKYDIHITVNENNTLNIKENIGAYFNVSKYGIFRKIPLRNEIVRLDGTTEKNRAQISNIKVNNKYSSYNERGYKVIKIGNPNYTLTGQQYYQIEYLYNLGKDKSKEYDELYFNLIGNEWDTVISNITFTIVMPKTFDASKIGFSSGIKGSTDSSSITYNVHDNVITGNYKGELEPSEGLTVRCELPEGYFVNAGLKINKIYYIIYVIPILLLLISIFIWYKYGRDNKVVETVEFYPPEGFNSLEVGFLYKGAAENQDVTSLLIYLANKGYIKISETEEKSLFSEIKGFKITKLKEYDGNNINEKMFLNGLFQKKPSILSLLNKDAEQTTTDDINEVTSIDLYDNFYITMNRILHNINTKENKNKILEKSATNKTIFIVLMIIATYCLITIPPIFASGNIENILIGLIFPGIGFSVLFAFLFGKPRTIYVNGKPTKSSFGTKMFGLVWGLGFGGIPWLVIVFPTLKEEPIYIIGYIIGLICVLGMILCIKYLPKRTPYGNEMLGRIIGFRNFLETAEKDKLESMVMQEPTYFYNILPYTYVLGISNKWIEKFETITMQAPSWYDSSSAFDMVAFGTFMSATMASAQKAMSSSPSTSSTTSSGGGSSGGGSGGGGGGSW